MRRSRRRLLRSARSTFSWATAGRSASSDLKVFQRADGERERRAELVRDVRKEAALEAVHLPEAFGLLLGLLLLLAELVLLRAERPGLLVDSHLQLLLAAAQVARAGPVAAQERQAKRPAAQPQEPPRFVEEGRHGEPEGGGVLGPLAAGAEGGYAEGVAPGRHLRVDGLAARPGLDPAVVKALQPVPKPHALGRREGRGGVRHREAAILRGEGERSACLGRGDGRAVGHHTLDDGLGRRRIAQHVRWVHHHGAVLRRKPERPSDALRADCWRPPLASRLRMPSRSV